MDSNEGTDAAVPTPQEAALLGPVGSTARRGVGRQVETREGQKPPLFPLRGVAGEGRLPLLDSVAPLYLYVVGWWQ